MLDFILCYAPTLLAFFFIKNDAIKYPAAILCLIVGTIALNEITLSRHSEMHLHHLEKHPL
jgi:hypothetical protein